MTTIAIPQAVDSSSISLRDRLQTIADEEDDGGELLRQQNSDYIEQLIEDVQGAFGEDLASSSSGTRSRGGSNRSNKAHGSPTVTLSKAASRPPSIIAALLSTPIVEIREEDEEDGLLNDNSSEIGLAMIRESSVGIDEEALTPRRPSSRGAIVGTKMLDDDEGSTKERPDEKVGTANNRKSQEASPVTAGDAEQKEEEKTAEKSPAQQTVPTGNQPSEVSRERSEGMAEEAEPEPPEEKLRDSEKYAIFFKMLRMGVPMPAVKNKMTQKGVNPQILDLGEEALMSKVLALERAFEAEQRQAKLPKKKGETIHWEAIPVTRLQNKETVFGGQDFELEKATLQHVQDLLEMFKKPLVEEKTENNEGKSMMKSVAAMMKKERVESVLDGRRAQSISIAMKKLKIHPDHPAKFTWALREMNESVINAQAVEVLMSCPLWPTSDEELNALKTKSESGAKLAEPDRLILFVIESVPDVVTRVNAMAFRWEFEASIIEAIKAAGDIKVATKTVLAHNNLKVVVRSAILIGNAINEESGVQIKGCTLSSLVKLATTKAARDKNSTVLDCVAGYCLRCYPDFSALSDLIPIVMAAKRIELETQVKAIRDMRRGVEAIRKMRQLEAFAFDAMRRLDVVESEMGVARDFYDMLLAYFGIQKGDMDTNIFFELLFQLIEHWNKAIAKKQKEVKSAAAAVMAAAAAKKAAEKAVLKAAEKAEKERQKQEEIDANRGKARLTVHLKGLFQRKSPNGPATPKGSDGPVRRLETRTSNLSAFASGGSVIGDEGSVTGVSLRKIRKSIFQKGGGGQNSPSEASMAMRPKGRKSIFWG